MHKNLLKQFVFAFIAGAILFGANAAAQTKKTGRKATNKTIEQTTPGVIYEADADLLNQMREQISIVESEQNWETLDRKTAVSNSAKTMTAYVAQFKIDEGSDALIDVVVVYGKEAGEFYEIRGFDVPRPFENLKWVGRDVVQFDQWVNGSNGGRYRVNLKTGEVIAAGYLRSN